MSQGSSATNIDRFYTLANVAFGCLEDIGEDESQFNRFLHFAYDGMRELAFDQSHEVLTAEIEMKSWKQIDFPPGMVDWTKIGFRFGNMIKILVRDGNIPKAFDLAADNITPLPNTSATPLDMATVVGDQIPFLGYGGYGGMSSNRIYGYGLGYNYLGYFDVDWKGKVFNFKDTLASDTKVYLEYITDGINYSGHTVIHPYTYNMMKAWVHWQRKRHDDRYSLGERREAMEIYNNMKMDVAIRQLNLSIRTIREILRSGYTLVPQN